MENPDFFGFFFPRGGTEALWERVPARPREFLQRARRVWDSEVAREERGGEKKGKV